MSLIPIPKVKFCTRHGRDFNDLQRCPACDVDNDPEFLMERAEDAEAEVERIRADKHHAIKRADKAETEAGRLKTSSRYGWNAFKGMAESFEQLQSEAVEHGAAYFDDLTGVFTWRSGKKHIKQKKEGGK